MYISRDANLRFRLSKTNHQPIGARLGSGRAARGGVFLGGGNGLRRGHHQAQELSGEQPVLRLRFFLMRVLATRDVSLSYRLIINGNGGHWRSHRVELLPSGHFSGGRGRAPVAQHKAERLMAFLPDWSPARLHVLRKADAKNRVPIVCYSTNCGDVAKPRIVVPCLRHGGVSH